MKKIFEVSIIRTCTDTAYIYAETIEEAEEKTQKLLDNGSVVVDDIFDGWQEEKIETETIRERTNSGGDKMNAEANEEALKELEEENA